MNESLAKHSEKLLVPKITNLIPVSRSVRDKVHARNSQWQKIEKGNLEITIKSAGGAANKKGSYGYLVFPNEGRGPRNHIEQRFMEKGLEAGIPEVVDGIQVDLIKKIEEEI
ncbi:hypothetical protein KHA87_01525 [Bacillus sp. FJAT-49736]|nr:hypothetical protein [Bacillus sp. FJAT-49736]